MIDYQSIGVRIRAVRIEKGLTQEQLAERAGVGTTHVSHIETGNTIPSLKVFIDIINTLGCSADELLCLEVKQAKPIFTGWIAQALEDCGEKETRIITDTVLALKASLRKQKVDEKE